MSQELTKDELQFLASQGLDSEDVFDARGYRQTHWFRLIKEEGKTVALGNPCRDAGHRLRSRKGHCVQCDTSKLAFAGRFDLEQYVYILGSVKARLIKIGTCKDLKQRIDQINFEQHAATSDWRCIAWVHAKRPGELESRVIQKLSKYRIREQYMKNGREQDSIELMKCSFSVAYAALNQIAGDALNKRHTISDTSPYEFRKTTT